MNATKLSNDDNDVDDDAHLFTLKGEETEVATLLPVQTFQLVILVCKAINPTIIISPYTRDVFDSPLSYIFPLSSFLKHDIPPISISHQSPLKGHLSKIALCHLANNVSFQTGNCKLQALIENQVFIDYL